MSLFVSQSGANAVQLERFLPRLSTANQVSEVRVRGWNSSKKSEIIGVAKPTRSRLGDKTGTQAAEQKHKHVLDIDVDVPVYSKEEADALAKSILNERLMNFITGDGSCHGHPDLKPGLIVSIDLGGGNDSGYQRFSGRYYLTAVRHRYRDRGQSAGFDTDFRFRRDAESES
jgi:phage protein D